MQKKRKLTKKEIQSIVSKIECHGYGMKDVSVNIRKRIQDQCTERLREIKIYPEMIPSLESEILKQYAHSLVEPGESVGVLTAQSIGEKNTQLVLNSVVKDTLIEIYDKTEWITTSIGEWIDNIIVNNPNVQSIPANRTLYAKLEGHTWIYGCNEDGVVRMHRILGVSKHLPVGKLIHIKTETGREVIATRQKSFLVWNGSKILPKEGKHLEIGDLVPVTCPRKTPTTNDVFFDPIISIIEVDETDKYVYDLTVEDVKNFQLANGLHIRDTFHSAGQAMATVVTGIPRFSELMSASKNPKSPITKIFFNRRMNSIQEIRKHFYPYLLHTTVHTITSRIYQRSTPRKWYDAYFLMNPIEIPESFICITIQTKPDMIFDRRLTLEDVAKSIQQAFPETLCIPSPEAIGIVDVWIDEAEVNDKTLKRLKTQTLKGVRGLVSIAYMKTDDNEHYVITNGYNIVELAKIPFVDIHRTLSNHIWEVFEYFGIEATREFLIQEFMDVVSSDGFVNKCHVQLLVDAMTFTGNVTSISRFGVHKNQSGPLTKASFEKTVDNFLRSAIYGEIDNTKGVSSSIVCGKPSVVGTGMCNLLYDGI